MQCEMCGKTISKAITITIEGSELQVCESCAKFGKRKILPKSKPKIQKNITKKHQSNNIQKTKETYKKYYKNVNLDEDISFVDNYPEKIKNKREHLNLTQEELAKKLNIKSNILHRIETGHLELNINTAKKLEKALNIKLIKINQDGDKKESLLNNYSINNKEDQEPTLGSMAIIRTRKKR